MGAKGLKEFTLSVWKLYTEKGNEHCWQEEGSSKAICFHCVTIDPHGTRTAGVNSVHLKSLAGKVEEET